MIHSYRLRPVEGNIYTILLVFAPVFGVAPNVTYSNTLCLARLEDQLKSGAILAYLFPSTGLKRLIQLLSGGLLVTLIHSTQPF